MNGRGLYAARRTIGIDNERIRKRLRKEFPEFRRDVVLTTALVRLFQHDEGSPELHQAVHAVLLDEARAHIAKLSDILKDGEPSPGGAPGVRLRSPKPEGAK
jgi:hypothetical protein